MNLHLLADIAVVAAGGAIGCLSRFGVEHIGWFDNDKYYYTLAINITGCMIIGILWGVLHHLQAERMWYLFLLTGCLGGYTTYSSFTLDTMLLLQDHRWLPALWYVSLTIIGGLGGCAIGLFGTERLIRQYFS